MKKQVFSFGMLLCGLFLFSCNNGTDSGTSSTTTDSSSMSTTTTTDNTGAMNDTSNKMSNMAGDSSGAAKMATSANNVGETEKKFMMDAAGGGMMEVQSSQLALQNASSDRVKAYANMMVQDHTNANNELKALASSKNVALPDSLPAKHREHLNMLMKKTGKDFDKAYINMMLMDHKEDVSKFQMASNNAKDADVKAFASKTLPTLKTHLDSVKAISTNIK